MKAAIYARVSTADQETQNQLTEMRKLAESQGWELAGEYLDQESGKTANRSQFQHLYEDAAKRRFDVVLFWALDRFTREGTLPTLQHLDRLTSYGIGFRSFTEPYLDSCGIFRDAVISILATVAKQERIRIAERTRAGVARARAEGKRIGRPPKEVTADQVRHLITEKNLSRRQAAKKLGVSPAWVSKHLSKPIEKVPSIICEQQ